MTHYCTGLLPKVTKYKTLQFRCYSADMPAPPASTSNLQTVYSALKVADPGYLFPMDGNDRIGDCAYAAKAHGLTLYRGVTGQVLVPTTAEVLSGYFALTGGQDTGLAGLDVLTDWHKNPWQGDAILAFAEVRKSSLTHVKQAIANYRGLYVGFQVQENAESDFDAGRPWEPGKLTDDGHAVYIVDYDAAGVTLLTWGAVQRATWAWFTECISEAYAILPPEAANPRFAPGFNIAALQADLAVVTA
jgi:hypothetical protein